MNTLLDAFADEVAALDALIARGELHYPALQRARLSASLYQLQPQLPIAGHEAFLAELHRQQKIAAIEQYHLDALMPRLQVEGPGLAALQSRRPAIYCSYHVGSYRLVLPYLLSQGVPVTMLIDAAVAERQGDDFERLLREHFASRQLAIDCVIRDTSKAHVLLPLLRDLRRGRSLLFFIDGNMSTSSAAEAQGVRCDFLGASLLARPGAAHLARLSGCPLLPLLPRRADTPLQPATLQVHAPLQVGADDAEVDAATRRLWALLEAAVRQAPTQWESWRYVDRSLDLSRLPRGEVPAVTSQAAAWHFDTQRYLVEAQDEGGVLFDRRSYRSLLISPALVALLQRLTQAALPTAELLRQPGMSEAALQRLVAQGMLCAAA